MNDKILEAVAKYKLFSWGDRLAVGLSGGADSVALTHFLWSIAAEWELELTALHLNHRLRGEESDSDEAFVRALCARWGIPLTVESAPVAAMARERGQTVEQCAREVRYGFFQRRAPDKICTAHTLSDNAETVLLNLTRGTGLRGLCGIPPVRGRIIRPLLLCTREEVEAYCAAHGLDFVTDSTNSDPSYTRNRLRRDVIPVLRALNPGFPQTLAGNVEALRADADYLDAQAAAALDDAGAGADTFHRAALLALPPPLRMRALRALLLQRGIPVDRHRLEDMARLLAAGSGGIQLSGRWLLRCSSQWLELRPAEPAVEDTQVPIPLEISEGEQTIPVFSGKVLRVTVCSHANFKVSVNNTAKPLKNAMDCDRIEKIVEFRLRGPGDSIRLAGRGCTKSLKKLYNEAGLTAAERRRNLVLAGQDGPLWVEGFGVAEAARVREDTRRVLIIEVLEDTVCTRM